MKRSADGSTSESARKDVTVPSLTPVPLHRLVLNDEPVCDIAALGNDGSTLLRSEHYWAVNAEGASTRNGLALEIPAGLRPPFSLMNDRAAAPCTGGVAVLTITGQTVFPTVSPPLSVLQLFESEALVLIYATHAEAVAPDGTTMILSNPSPPASYAHDTSYTSVDVVTVDGNRYRFTELSGWFPVTLPMPDCPARLAHYNARTGASAWITATGLLLFYHLDATPMVTLLSGQGAVVTSSSRYAFVLNDTATFPSGVPEVGLIDTQSLHHETTLFPDSLMCMGRMCDGELKAAHYPYIVHRNALFKLE